MNKKINLIKALAASICLCLSLVGCADDSSPSVPTSCQSICEPDAEICADMCDPIDQPELDTDTDRESVDVLIADDSCMKDGGC